VLHYYDVLISGGGLVGCLSAISAARRGLKVVLIESRTYLGREFTATLRPWISTVNVNYLNNGLKSILGIDEEDLKVTNEGALDEIPLYLGTIKKNLLKELQNAGVTVLFLTGPASLLYSKANAIGLVTGGKTGLYAILPSLE